jgi:hypothetical protein
VIRSAAVRVGLGVGCQGRNGPRGGESGDLGWRVGPGPARGERSRVPEAVGVQNFRNSVFPEADIRDSIPERVQSA